MPYSTLTVKGQATIPIQIRKLLNLKPADKLHFRVHNGKVILEAKKKDPMSLFGKYKPKAGKKVSLNGMDNAILSEAEAMQHDTH